MKSGCIEMKEVEVSASKPAVDDRKEPFKQPAIKKLTLEQAKKVLESQSDPADENGAKLLEEINRRLKGK